MNTSSLITGIVMVVLGFILIIVPIFYSEVPAFVFLMYGIPLFIIGIFILFNRKEDSIEERKDLLKKGNKR